MTAILINRLTQISNLVFYCVFAAASSIINDEHSCSNFGAVVTRSIHLSLRCDFELSVMRGHVDIVLQQLSGCDSIMLDCKVLSYKYSTFLKLM